METACKPAWRRFATARPLRVWGTSGPGPVAVVIWTPIVLLDPLTSMPRYGSAAWLWLAAIVATNVGAVAYAYRARPTAGRFVLALLGLQTLTTFAATWWFGAFWGALFTLLGLTYGAIAPPRWTPPAIVTLTIVCTGVAWWQGATESEVWVPALITLLSGMATFGFHRLLTVIVELDATRQELARQAVDQERLRFARDLHDLLGHTLSVIVVKSEAIRRLLPANAESAAQHAGDIESIGRQALLEVREAVSGYRDTDLNRELERAKIATEACGITLRTDVPAHQLPTAVDTLFGWVVREAVTNVVRHSEAAACQITLVSQDTPAVLTVIDDGRGGDPASGGGGLQGLRERAENVGGKLAVSYSGHGFTVRAEVPFTKDGEVT